MVNTSNRAGQDLVKHFRIYSNDPKQPQAELIISGKVFAFAEITPKHLTFQGKPGETLTQEVRIVPRKEYPFTIKLAKARNGLNIRTDLKPLGKKPAESGYLLKVTCQKKEPGGFIDVIELQTDSKEKPILTIPVNGRMAEAGKSD